MTDEQLMNANHIKHELRNIEAQIEIVSSMEEEHASVSLYHSGIGSVQLTQEVCDQVLGIVLDNLLTQAEELRKEFEEL